jgi:hypothetical protein
VDGTIEIEGETVDFEISMLEERIDVEDWIDYWIGCQVFQLWDNVMHNSILYSGSDKKKFYLFFYDLDTSLEDKYPYNEDLLDICENPYGKLVIPTTFWQKFIDEYKDSIINRYAYLRKTVLSDVNIKSIYTTIISDIPEEVIVHEITRWGNGNPRNFDAVYNKLVKRLTWLDETQFNL